MTDLLLLLIAAIPLLLGWVVALVDLIRRRDLNMRLRVLWFLVLLLVPVVGLAVYLVVRPRDAPTSPPTTKASIERTEALVKAAERHHRGEIDSSAYRKAVERLGIALGSGN